MFDQSDANYQVSKRAAVAGGISAAGKPFFPGGRAKPTVDTLTGRITRLWPATWLRQFILLAAISLSVLTQITIATASDTNLIVRLYYGDRTHLDELTAKYDVLEFADHVSGYVAARLSLSDYEELQRAGYRVEIDPEQTVLANPARSTSIHPLAGVPSFPCYRTVEETYATLMQMTNDYPALATLVDIGDSWDKITPGGASGYDLFALVLSNKSRPGPKPRFLLVAEFHARELTTAETATRFAEELVAGYGVDADITWILDYFEVHIVPMANPDGRKQAELGQLWRKNTDNTNGCASSTSFGTDLNRNWSFRWGLDAGSSPSSCNETYRGPLAFSEPESQAIRDYIQSLFPDQRGPADTDVAPTNTTGLVISLHSYAQLVLYSWGWTTTPAPNAPALQTLGGKFGFFNRYTVQPSIALYAVSGELTDWVYGELGVPGYTIEMGTSFFEPCATFQSTTYPSNRPALYYAAKACRQPYLSAAGPDVLKPTVSNTPGASVTLSANAVSGRTFGYAPLPAAANITAARYSVDNPSWVSGVVTHPMSATDGSFNSTNETIAAVIDTTGWTPGKHTLFVEARTSTNTWGVPTAAFVFVSAPTILASLESNQIVLRWPSSTNALYTLLQTSNLLSPFSVLASNILATPPTNTYADPVSPTGSLFYRLKLQP